MCRQSARTSRDPIALKFLQHFRICMELIFFVITRLGVTSGRRYGVKGAELGQQKWIKMMIKMIQNGVKSSEISVKNRVLEQFNASTGPVWCSQYF